MLLFLFSFIDFYTGIFISLFTHSIKIFELKKHLNEINIQLSFMKLKVHVFVLIFYLSGACIQDLSDEKE